MDHGFVYCMQMNFFKSFVHPYRWTKPLDRVNFPVKELNKGENLTSIVDFEPISCTLPDINEEVLSTNQKYLYQICKAISSGMFPDWFSPETGHNSSRKIAYTYKSLTAFIC